MVGIMLLWTTVLSTMIPHLTPITPWAPPHYNYTIGTPPRQVWAPIVKEHRQALDIFLKRFDYLHIPDVFFWGLEWWGDNYFAYKEFIEEIKALAEVADVRWGKLLFLNFMYEYSTLKACTGVLIRDGFGKILHGRNIDFEMFGMLSKLVVTINFFEKQQIVYSGNFFVGSVFVLTGIRHGAFGISQDTRKSEDFYTVLYNLIVNGGMPSPWLIREVLEHETSFQGAVHRLNTTHIASPTYYIISGVQHNQGAVIERDIHNAHGYYQLNQDRWFLVQTNYDRDIPDPSNDYRRIPAQKRIERVGQGRMDERLLSEEVMEVWPTFNIGTIFTAIIVPHNSYMNTTIWYCRPKHDMD